MPQGEERRVLVWTIGGALVAAPIEVVVEVAPVEGGRTSSRAGSLEVQPVPGLHAEGEARRAVVLRASGGLLAIAADDVDGVRSSMLADQSPTPDWLSALPTEHVAALLQLPDARVAVLLAVDSLDI